jgi:Protein of unknown function (DUF3575)
MYQKTICLAITLLFLTNISQAQIRLKANKEVKNVVKLGLDNLINARFDFAYERHLFAKQTAGVEVAFGVPVSIPTQYLKSFSIENISTQTPNDTALSVKINDGRWQVWQIQPEYRFYFGKEDAPRGFYLGVYGKFKSRGFTASGNYTRPDTIDRQNMVIETVSATAKVAGGLRTIGVGGFLGYHFIINDRISIDISPIGLGFDMHNVYLKVESNDADVSEYFPTWKEKIDAQVKEIPIVGNSFKTTTGTSNNGLPYIKSGFWFPFVAYRGNVWIGYSF